MTTVRKRHTDLPRKWTEKAVEKLAEKGITVSKNRISKVYGGFEKSSEHQVEILQVILSLKAEFKKGKQEEEELRTQLNA